MTHEIGSGQLGETFNLHDASPWIWLFEVHIGSGEVAYITPYDAQVTFDGQVYHPYPMTIPTVPESKETALGTTQVTIYQLDSMVSDYLRDEQLIGQSCFIRLVHVDHLAETDVIAHEVRILGAEVSRDRRAVSLTLGSYNWLNKTPGQRFLRLRCRHVYGSEACGYDTARTGALATCKRTYDDCVAHGDDEESVGMQRYHPLRFGGFPALPRQNRG